VISLYAPTGFAVIFLSGKSASLIRCKVQVEQESGQACVRRRPAQLRTALPGDRESSIRLSQLDDLFTSTLLLDVLSITEGGDNRSDFPREVTAAIIGK